MAERKIGGEASTVGRDLDQPGRARSLFMTGNKGKVRRVLRQPGDKCDSPGLP